MGMTCFLNRKFIELATSTNSYIAWKKILHGKTQGNHGFIMQANPVYICGINWHLGSHIFVHETVIVIDFCAVVCLLRQKNGVDYEMNQRKKRRNNFLN